jgi:hypothetical protein
MCNQLYCADKVRLEKFAWGWNVLDKPDIKKPQFYAEYQYRGSSVGILTARRKQEIFIFF